MGHRFHALDPKSSRRHFLRHFEWLLAGWTAQGYDLVSLATLYDSIDRANLPRREVVFGEVPGRSGTLALQAKEPA